MKAFIAKVFQFSSHHHENFLENFANMMINNYCHHSVTLYTVSTKLEGVSNDKCQTKAWSEHFHENTKCGGHNCKFLRYSLSARY